MLIKKIEIKNYRGIKNQTLNFTNFNTLIGKNDCGKSTIINAIKLFFNDEKVSIKDFNFYQVEPQNIEITVVLSNFQPDKLKAFLVKGEKDDGFDEVIKDYLDDGNLVIKKIWSYKENSEVSASMEIQIASFKDYEIHGANTAQLKKWGAELDAQPAVDGSGNNSDMERRAALRQKLVDMENSREMILVTVKNKDLQDILPSIEWLKADHSIETTTSEFKGTFATEIRNIINKERESGELSTLSGIEEKITSKINEESEVIKKCMSEHISDLSELIITPSFSWEKGVEITDVRIQLTGDQKLIPLVNKGSGYRRLFMVGRLRYLAEKKQITDVIYLVEEPETFLHPSAQEEMLHSLLSLAESNQIFVTTHSPIFTGATCRNALTLCKKMNSELIYEQRCDDAFLFEIAKQLGVKPSHNILDTYKALVFVEGCNDRKFLKIASEKLEKALHDLEAKGEIAIIEGGGESLGNFIDIQFFESQGKTMFLIIDSDDYDPEQITDAQKRKNLDRKSRENRELKEKFEQKKNAKCFILKKKNIDTYYHPRAIKRINNTFPDLAIFPDSFCFPTYVSSINDLIQGNLPKKNCLSYFIEMTSDEWREVSNGELEEIFDEIVEATHI